MELIDIKDHPANLDKEARLTDTYRDAHIYRVSQARYVVCLPEGKAIPGYFISMDDIYDAVDSARPADN